MTIKKLTGFSIGELSIVDRGANQRTYAVTKSEDTMKTLEAVLKTEAEGESALVEKLKAAGMDEEGIQAAVAQFRLAAGFKDVLGTNMGEVLKAAGVDAPSPDASAGASASPAQKAEVEVPEEIKKQWDAIQKQNDELTATIKAEREARRKADFTAKAEREFTHIPGSAEELGEQLMKAYGVGEEFGKQLEDQWASMNASLKQSALLHKAGTPGRGNSAGTAWGKIEALAKDLVTKSAENGNGMSQAKAVSHVIETNKALYEEYLMENPKQIGA